MVVYLRPDEIIGLDFTFRKNRQVADRFDSVTMCRTARQNVRY